MEKIIAEIHHIIKDSNHVLDAETTLQAYFSDLVSQLMKEALEALDSELYVPLKRKDGVSPTGIHARLLSHSVQSSLCVDV